MVNKRMKAAAALRLARAAARKQRLIVEVLPGRGKGSHQVYVVLNSAGEQVSRFQLTSHGNKDVSIGILRSMEDALTHLFGERWMEK